MTIPSRKQSATKLNTLRKKKKLRDLNPELNISAIDVARWFIQGNSWRLPDDLSRPLLGALRSRDVPAIRRLLSEFDSPQLYENPNDYYVVAQSAALLTKVPFPFGDGDQARRAQAVDKFLLSEKLCRISSRRLDFYSAHPDREDPVMRVIFSRARALIDTVLGSVDNAFDRIMQLSRFGPGMTMCSTDSARTTPYYKLGADYWSVSATCRPYADTMVLQSPVWTLHQGDIDWSAATVRLPWRIVQSCRIAFVPKDERTFRTIAIEPFGNVSVQLGVHEYLTKRLKQFAGIDIHSQEWNQKAALEGSKNWLSRDTVSTIDLSMASDCVSPGLIRRLVRPQWVALLDDIRSHNYELDGVERPFSKWSSMGNGYTFALETLLFWALAQTCEEYCKSQQKALAYGDDIIVSRRSSLLVLQVLRYAGFKVNSSKTNVVGPFRESCGADFHSGVTVRPFYQRSFIPRVTDAFVILNSLSTVSRLDTFDVCQKVLQAIPDSARCYGPASLAMDSHIHMPYWWLHEHKPKGFRFNRGIQNYQHRALVFKPRRFFGDETQRCLTWLYNSSRAFGGSVSPFKEVHPRFFSHFGLIPEIRESGEVVVTDRKSVV